jgi:hypothetical protein
MSIVLDEGNIRITINNAVGARMARKEQLERKLPLHGPPSHPWPRPIVASCGVFNMRSWNERFPDYPVKRL